MRIQSYFLLLILLYGCIDNVDVNSKRFYCESDKDCVKGYVCINNECVKEGTITDIGLRICRVNEDCFAGERCIDGVCKEVEIQDTGGDIEDLVDDMNYIEDTCSDSNCDIEELSDFIDSGVDAGCKNECYTIGKIICESEDGYRECIKSEDGCMIWSNKKYCSEPPKNYCLDSKKLRVYDTSGKCVNDRCEYGYNDKDCLNGCENGMCKNCTPDCSNKECGDDGCGGSCGSCNSVPANYCLDASTLRNYDGTSLCKNNRCVCNYSDIHCQYGCSNGKCSNCTPDCTNKECGDDGCGGICGSCNSVPADYCVNASTLRDYTGTSSCQSYHCVYGYRDISCQYGCLNGQCKSCVPDCTNKECGDDGCGGSCGVCTNIPTDYCVSSTTLRDYDGTSSCQNNKCVYNYRDVICGSGRECSSGRCIQTYTPKRVGIFYHTWHAFASDAFYRIPSYQRWTIEDIIRLQPGKSFADILLIPGMIDEARWFHYQVLPLDGVYCIYKKRPGDPVYSEPNYASDCDNIEATLERHARQIWESGVDFVFVDITNLPFVDEFSDVIGIRPVEVLAEGWRALRDRGVLTPQIAVWVPVPPKNSGLEEWTVDRIMERVYNNPEYDDLILRDPHSGKKVLFLVENNLFAVDNTKRANLEINGGRNDIITVKMWGLLSQSELQGGKASWMQPCVENGTWTTIIKAGNLCSQSYTQNSPVGSVLSVSASYQIAYASLPFGATGKQEGLTLKKQFETAFKIFPDWLLINSWNEFIAQPQTSNQWIGIMGDLAVSMGVYASSSDPSRGWLWVDGYGYEFARDIEPTVIDQGSILSILKSCLRVYRLGGCSAPGASSEECCKQEDTLRLIYSLRENDPSNSMNTRHILTSDSNEKDVLIYQGWEEVCNPIIGVPGICSRADAGLSADGPFQVFVKNKEGRVGLYRCINGFEKFFSTDSNCEGRPVDGLLGYISTVRTSEAPRPLARCYNTDTNVHFHWIGEQCPDIPNVRHEAVVGFVR